MSFDEWKQLKHQVMQISNYIIWRHPTTAFLGAIKRFEAKIIKDRFSSCPFNLLLREMRPPIHLIGGLMSAA